MIRSRATQSPSVVILDYGFGNLRSAERALAGTGARVRLTADAEAARAVDGLVVPGAGAFAACMSGLRAVGGDAVIADRVRTGRPVLGICVGHQVLFGRGAEHGADTAGCGVLSGTVERLAAERLPHVGWNTIIPPAGSALFADLAGEYFYFVHSYAVRTDVPDALVAWTEHGSDWFVAAVEAGAVCSTQFHPKKSGAAGATPARQLGPWTWLSRRQVI